MRVFQTIKIGHSKTGGLQTASAGFIFALCKINDEYTSTATLLDVVEFDEKTAGWQISSSNKSVAVVVRGLICT